MFELSETVRNLAGYLIFVSVLIQLPNVVRLAPAAPGTANVCLTAECKIAAENLIQSMDTSVEPCDDFYRYACGNWPRAHPASSLIPESPIQIKSDINDAEILDFLKKNNSEDEPLAVHKARKLFSQCLDEESIYKKGIQPVKDILSKIGLPAIPPISNDNDTTYDYISAAAKAFRLSGIKIFFDVQAEPNPYNQTFNVIGISKPADSYDQNTIPLKRSPLVSNASPASTVVIKEAMITMCENSTVSVCSNLTSGGWGAVIYEYFILPSYLKYEDDRTDITLKARSKLNTTATATMHTLHEIQTITDKIANEASSTIPTFNWTRYIEEVFADVPNVTLDLSDPRKVQVGVYEMDYIEDMLKFIHSKTLIKHEFGLWWNVIDKLLPYVDAKISKIKNKITSVIVSPKSREQKCSQTVAEILGMAVSYYYTTKPEYLKSKPEVQEMVKNIRHSFELIVKQADWMDKKTKERSINKINSLKSYVAFPSIIKTTKKLDEFYADFEIADTFLETMIQKVQRYIKKNLSKFNRINDINLDEWEISPNIVNAFYEPNKNTILIPAGIIGQPIYHNALKALDYGSMGSILGHEITHGFDNAGRRYNEIGDVEDWWEPETLAAYKQKAKCFIDAYDKYSVTINNITQKVDSKNSFPENIADNGGFKEALLAYRKYVSEKGEEFVLPQFENFTHEQLFTLAFANVWCETPTTLSPLVSPFLDHSPNGVRVNGVLKNSEDFVSIWNCKKPSGMNSETTKCSIW